MLHALGSLRKCLKKYGLALEIGCIFHLNSFIDKKIAFGDNSNARFSVVRKVFYTFLYHKNLFSAASFTVRAFYTVGALCFFFRQFDRPGMFA